MIFFPVSVLDIELCLFLLNIDILGKTSFSFPFRYELLTAISDLMKHAVGSSKTKVKDFFNIC